MDTIKYLLLMSTKTPPSRNSRTTPYTWFVTSRTVIFNVFPDTRSHKASTVDGSHSAEMEHCNYQENTSGRSESQLRFPIPFAVWLDYWTSEIEVLTASIRGHDSSEVALLNTHRLHLKNIIWHRPKAIILYTL